MALINPHSCQPPCCSALCQGRPIGRRATSAAVEADAGRGIAAMTRLERMTDRPAALDRKGRRTHGLMAVGGWSAVFVVGGVTDRCLCRTYRDGLLGASARTHPLPSIPLKRPLRPGRCQPQSTARQQLRSPPHCFLYETAEGSALSFLCDESVCKDSGSLFVPNLGVQK